MPPYLQYGNKGPNVGPPDDVARRAPDHAQAYASQTDLLALLAQQLQTPAL